MLERIADIRNVITSDDSQIDIGTVRSVGEHFQRVLARRGTGKDQRDAHLFTHAAEEMATIQRVKAMQARKDAECLRDTDNTLLEFTKEMVRKHRNGVQYALALLFAAAAQDQENRDPRNWPHLLAAGTHPSVSHLSMPGPMETISIARGKRKTEKIEVPSNHRFLLDNMRDNYLRLITGDEIDYDELHRRNMYLFTTRDEPTLFAYELTSFANGPQGKDRLIDKKDICEIGVGSGADAEFFLTVGRANSVTAVDGSSFVMRSLRKRRNSLPAELQGKFEIPEADDMFDAFEYFHSIDKKFHTICAHSSVHYYGDDELRALLRLLHRSLHPGGHLAISVKAPGAILDGNGIPIIRHEKMRHDTDPSDPPKVDVRDHTWLNYDGQKRTFRGMDRWVRILDEKFDVRRRGETKYPDYSVPGQGDQLFLHFICARKEDEPVIVPLTGQDAVVAYGGTGHPVLTHPPGTSLSMRSANHITRNKPVAD